MKTINIFAALGCVTLAGCAIEPTPDQTTGSYTFEIANHIRCEARKAIVAQVVKLLIDFDQKSIADRLENGDAKAFKDAEALIPHQSKELQERIKLYKDVAIAYEFQLDITEENVNKFDLNLLGIFPKGTSTTDIGAGLDRSRQNLRIFTIADTFKGLVEDDNVCKKNDPPQRIDYVYPMAGRIGIKDAVDNFIDLNELSRKSASHKLLSPDKNGKTEVYSVTFRFTTIIQGNLNPSFTNNPTNFGPNLGTVTNTAKRTDDHQVIVGFSLPDPPKTEKDKKTAVPSTSVELGFFGFAETATGGAGARAKQAIHDAKVDYFLQNFNLNILLH